MIYLQLYLSFFQIGVFRFGGGYAALPLLQEQVVNTHHWLTMEELTHLITISQMTPGPIAINSATFVGTKVAGITGSVVATLGFVTPSFIIMSILTWVYFKYRNTDSLKIIMATLRPAVAAIIGAAGISIIIHAFWDTDAAISLTGTHWLLVGIFGLCVGLLRTKKLSPVMVIILAGVLNLLFALIGVG